MIGDARGNSITQRACQPLRGFSCCPDPVVFCVFPQWLLVVPHLNHVLEWDGILCHKFRATAALFRLSRKLKTKLNL